MASYFDEHDCKPLADGEQPNHILHLARLLIDGGYGADMEFNSIFEGQGHAPPASKKTVAELPKICITDKHTASNMKCPICLSEFTAGETARRLPCDHLFHSSCILPWLERTNTCPFCRHELPTDNPDYEEHKKQKARAEQRAKDLENLHDSMYG